MTELKMVQHLRERILHAVPSRIRHVDVSVKYSNLPLATIEDDVEVLFEARLFTQKIGPRKSIDNMRSRAVQELTHHLYGDVYDDVFEILQSAYDDQYKTPTTDKLEALLSKLRP